jgi:drug/metabolite transporter (DMT)-like permease
MKFKTVDLIAGVFGLVNTITFIYGIATSPWHVYWTHVLAFACLIAFFIIIFLKKKGRPLEVKIYNRTSTSYVDIFIFLAGTSVAFGMMAYGFVVSIVALFERLATSATQLEIVVATFILGVLLWVFRHYLRGLYGATETIMGILVASNSFNHRADKTEVEFIIGMLTAGSYLVVRGLDNMHQYHIGKADDGALDWIRKKIENQQTQII